jgi:hypothetical protein
MKMPSWAFALMAGASMSLAIPTVAWAYTWTVSGTVGGETVNAQAVVTVASGQVTVALTNLQGNSDEGQAISGFDITFGATPNSPTLSSSSGSLITVNSNGTWSFGYNTFTDLSQDNHWGIGQNGSTVCLATVAAGGSACQPQGKPYDLIVGQPGAGNLYSSGTAALFQHNPQVQTNTTGDSPSAATFVINISGLSASAVISSVTFLFGTTPNSVTVPGPIVGAGLPGLVAACGGLIALARRRRRKFA